MLTPEFQKVIHNKSNSYLHFQFSTPKNTNQAKTKHAPDSHTALNVERLAVLASALVEVIGIKCTLFAHSLPCHAKNSINNAGIVNINFQNSSRKTKIHRIHSPMNGDIWFRAEGGFYL